MDLDALQHLIAQKLTDRRLPHENIVRIAGRPANGETCDACEHLIAPGQFVMRGGAMHFHVDCLYLWDVARQALAAAAAAEHAARP
jgi:hypothetical protein